MDQNIIEASYPLTFKEKEAKILGQHLKSRHNVVLIGMIRVGISGFLRYFLYHKDIPKTFIQDANTHLFIPVDLNNLVEREIFPFWILTLKRIADSAEKSSLNIETKKYIENLFLDGIQSKELFLVIEGVRKAISKIVESGIIPTIFFIHFDRMKEAATPEFFNNLEGLRDSVHQKLSYVITSFKGLDKLSPSVFIRTSLSAFIQEMYIKPAKKQDTEIIYNSCKDIYKLKLDPAVEHELFDAVDGYNQYLQLSLIHLHGRAGNTTDAGSLLEALSKDERINLQSEELWESLSEKEQSILIKLTTNQALADKDIEEGRYLLETGFIVPKDQGYVIFSPLFTNYLKKHRGNASQESNIEFSKKEHTLFNFLKDNLDQVCEREAIIEAVWPEEDILGVTDWAIDRLVARLRNKLKQQKSSLEIVTIKTRGYKIVNTKK